MQAIPVKHNQTNLDIALMAYGTIERVFELPNLQSQSLTDDLVAGDVVEVTEAADFNYKDVATILNRKELIPASGKGNNLEIPQLEGIGYWSIGVDFIVS